MSKPKISVITWDAGFRESYHTVDFFSRQTLAKENFEFIWADYYSTLSPELMKKIQLMGNGRTFQFQGKGKWHLGITLNAAIQESQGDLLVIPDGDIVVEENFLEEVIKAHKYCEDLTLYFRRWDEPNIPDVKKKNITIETLKSICILNNPTNYGGCLTISKKNFSYVRGYEEHTIFSEAGANGMELYVRLKNAGFHIMWHPEQRVYHPRHEGSYPHDPEYLKKLDIQNWLIKKRDLEVVFEANTENAEEIIGSYQNKNPSKSSLFQKAKNLMRI